MSRALPVKLRVRTDLKPPGIVQVRAHELQREDTNANRDEKQREEYRYLVSIDSQRFSRKGAKIAKTAKAG
jgi:hypothetical protein